MFIGGAGVGAVIGQDELSADGISAAATIFLSVVLVGITFASTRSNSQMVDEMRIDRMEASRERYRDISHTAAEEALRALHESGIGAFVERGGQDPEGDWHAARALAPRLHRTLRLVDDRELRVRMQAAYEMARVYGMSDEQWRGHHHVSGCVRLRYVVQQSVWTLERYLTGRELESWDHGDGGGDWPLLPDLKYDGFPYSWALGPKTDTDEPIFPVV